MDKGVVKRVIVTPDKHFPLHDQPAINCLKKTIEIVKPDAYIDLGDVGEWEAFSHWKYKRRIAPPLEFLIKEFECEFVYILYVLILQQQLNSLFHSLFV